MPKTSNAPSRKLLGERGVAQKLLGDFEPEGSRGMEFLMNFFHNQISVNRLISLATLFSKMLGIKFPRNYKRNRELLILWFDMNLDAIQPFSSRISMVLENSEDSS